MPTVTATCLHRHFKLKPDRKIPHPSILRSPADSTSSLISRLVGYYRFFFLYFICFWVLTVFTNVQKNKVTNSMCLYLTQTYYTNKNTLKYTTGQRNRNKKKKEASLDCNE